MWIKKHWKKLLVATIGVAVLATSLSVLLYPQTIKATDIYLMQFNDVEPGAKAKNDYLKQIIQNTRSKLDEYSQEHQKKYNTPFEGLTFDYTNLNSSQSDGEKNFYIALNRSMKEIDSRLAFNNMARTPETVNEGFYNRNTEMMSFYWSPDYNNIGTWVKYMLSDNFSMPNFWPAIYAECEKNQLPWASSLKTEMQKYTFDGHQSLYLNHPEIISFTLDKTLNKNNMTVDDCYVNIANVIGKWISENSGIDAIKSPDKVDTDGNHIDGTLIQYKNPGLGIQLVNFIASNYSNIPFVEDGPWTETPWLVRDGFYNPINANADTNYRDWFYDHSITPKSTIRIWNSGNPFTNNKTPFNPAFSISPTSAFFQSTWTGLTTWSNIGDENSNSLPPPSVDNHLVANGTTSDLNSIKQEFVDQKTMTFKIRPIPWININGEIIRDTTGNPYYLSPEDFWAGFQSFGRSVAVRINSNAYFFDLLGIDIKRTLEYAPNIERNISSLQQKEFKIFFLEPKLSAIDCLDILQKQYFNALPAFKSSVRNITINSEWNKVAILTNNGSLDTNRTNMDLFYGSGDWRQIWRDLAFTSPYYLNNVTNQSLNFKINPYYFEAFNSESAQNPEYESFKLENKNIKKFSEVDVKYAGSYSESILFEQFKSNELDVSPIQAANIVDVTTNYKNDLSYVRTDKLNRSNIVGYNLQIYEKNLNGIILNENNQPMWDDIAKKPTYTTDDYGNYEFHGQTPKRKSKVSREYEDLIVRDFFTPNGISQTIRSTINNSINWISMQTLVFPGITKSIQYSFLPYGVYNMDVNFSINPTIQVPPPPPKPFNDVPEAVIRKYWYYAAFKKNLTDVELSEPLIGTILQKRATGSIIWSYGEMLSNLIK